MRLLGLALVAVGLCLAATSALHASLPPGRTLWATLPHRSRGQTATAAVAARQPEAPGARPTPGGVRRSPDEHDLPKVDALTTRTGDGKSWSVPAAEANPSPQSGPAAPIAPFFVPITRLRVARIGLDADVVEAPLVQVGAGMTWEVPAFKVGHGENTADAGEPGNAVLLGHVTSTNAGNVFKDLRVLRSGDVVQVFGGADEFDYVVTQVRSVPRTDVSVLQPTETPSVTLITCSGVWLPAIGDYTERLIVRAELRPRE